MEKRRPIVRDLKSRETEREAVRGRIGLLIALANTRGCTNPEAYVLGELTHWIYETPERVSSFLDAFQPEELG